jgi:flavin-binding protein dodecin
MSSTVYKKIEITGASTESIEDAVNTAIARSAKTVRNMRWFEVTEVRGTINEDSVREWQVTVKVGFAMDD